MPRRGTLVDLRSPLLLFGYVVLPNARSASMKS